MLNMLVFKYDLEKFDKTKAKRKARKKEKQR